MSRSSVLASTLAVLLGSNMCGACGACRRGAVAEAAVVCDNVEAAAPPTDPRYRVVVGASASGSIPFPAPGQSWELEYRFTTPAMPCSATWNHTNQVFYDWGDVDFDMYGANGTTPLSKYKFNQIVPQVMTGWVLSGNDASYLPTWTKVDHWVIQAQYFWQDANGTTYDQAGPIVDVRPGDELTTRIAYDSSSGAITASIAGSAGTSSITIVRPFPNERPALFASWRHFFEQAVTTSGTSLVGRPMLNVETQWVDNATVCATLPFTIGRISLPGIPGSSSSFQLRTEGGLACPAKKLVDFKL